MVIVFKKRYLLIFPLLTAIFLMCIFSPVKKEGEEVSAYPTFGKTIVLDAGHGEPDGGAVGVSGTKEDELNLKVMRYLQEYLEKSGTKVILTRADENGIFDKDEKKHKAKKSFRYAQQGNNHERIRSRHFCEHTHE